MLNAAPSWLPPAYRRPNWPTGRSRLRPLACRCRRCSGRPWRARGCGPPRRPRGSVSVNPAERAFACHSARSASLARIFTRTARPALITRRRRWGGQRGHSPPPAPAGDPRRAWPQWVCWLSRLSGVRQARPTQPRTLRLDAPQEIRHMPLELLRPVLHTRSRKHRVGESRNRMANRLFPTCLTPNEMRESGFRRPSPVGSRTVPK